MPGFFLFNTAAGVELVSIGPGTAAALLTSIAASGSTALLIIAMALGLIPRMLYEGLRPPPNDEARSFNAPQGCPRLIRNFPVPDSIRAAGPGESVP